MGMGKDWEWECGERVTPLKLACIVLTFHYLRGVALQTERQKSWTARANSAQFPLLAYTANQSQRMGNSMLPR